MQHRSCELVKNHTTAAAALGTPAKECPLRGAAGAAMTQRSQRTGSAPLDLRKADESPGDRGPLCWDHLPRPKQKQPMPSIPVSVSIQSEETLTYRLSARKLPGTPRTSGAPEIMGEPLPLQTPNSQRGSPLPVHGGEASRWLRHASCSKQTVISAEAAHHDRRRQVVGNQVACRQRQAHGDGCLMRQSRGVSHLGHARASDVTPSSQLVWSVKRTRASCTFCWSPAGAPLVT